MAQSDNNCNPAPPTQQEESVGHLNVYGKALIPCCYEPLTGYFRDGFCRTDQRDHGVHTVCAVMTQDFLEYSKSRGNDLMTATSYFPGLKAGDKWCLCVSRWKEAYDAGYAPNVYLDATHIKSLDVVPLTILEKHAIQSN